MTLGAIMKYRYPILLFASGLIWFLVAAALGSAVPILGEEWFPHLICAIVTAFAVGFIFGTAIFSWSGWRWYALPLLTLFVASGLFGFLLPLSWSLTGTSGTSVDSEAFYKMPLSFIVYAMTLYLVILYPIALLTQLMLKKSNSQTHGS